MYYFYRVCLSAMYKPDNWGVVSNMLTHRKISHKIQTEILFLYVIVMFAQKIINNYISPNK